MKKTRSRYRRIVDMFFAALLGHTRLPVTLAVYASLALTMLAYVSAQVYAGKLAQDISHLTKTRSHQSERLNRLTSAYVSMSSRASVAKYCEEKLGMVKPGSDALQRFALDDATHRFLVPVEITERRSPMTTPFGFTLHREAAGVLR